jgi:hypothetical protein
MISAAPIAYAVFDDAAEGGGGGEEDGRGGVQSRPVEVNKKTTAER